MDERERGREGNFSAQIVRRVDRDSRRAPGEVPGAWKDFGRGAQGAAVMLESLTCPISTESTGMSGGPPAAPRVSDCAAPAVPATAATAPAAVRVNEVVRYGVPPTALRVAERLAAAATDKIPVLAFAPVAAGICAVAALISTVLLATTAAGVRAPPVNRPIGAITASLPVA
jgi:hypothetical protein